MIAAAIAACYPYLWINDAGLWSESLLAVFVALVLLTADAAGQQPSVRRAAWLGVAVGLAALTRAEQLLLVPLLVWPLLLLRGTSTWRERLVRTGAATLATVLVITPWVGWNLTRFDHPVFMSTDLGGTVFNTNCDLVWRGADIGWWTFLPSCPGDISPRDAPDESTRDLRLRSGRPALRAHAPAARARNRRRTRRPRLERLPAVADPGSRRARLRRELAEVRRPHRLLRAPPAVDSRHRARTPKTALGPAVRRVRGPASRSPRRASTEIRASARRPRWA